MADKTYKLNISKSDGSFSDSVHFTIPQREGTYKIEFELSNGNKVNAGNINVSTVKKTYKAEFKLSDGRTIDGGTFSTPLIPYTLYISEGANSTILITRTSSPIAGAATGALTNRAKIYDGDTLKILFSAASGYKLETHTVNGTTYNSPVYWTVSSNVSVVATAVSAASWHSITNEGWSGSWTYTAAGDYSIEGFSGLVAGRPTRYTGTVTKGQSTTNFTTEETPFTSGVVTFNTPTTNGSVSFNVASAGPLPKTKVTLVLTKIEQYY